MTSAPPREEMRASQPERTVLAWNRASIAVAANGLLLLRAGIVDHLGVLAGTGLAVVVIGVALWVASVTRYSALPGQPARHLIAGKRGAVFALAAFVASLSLIDLAAVGVVR